MRFDEWNAIVRAWTARHTTAEIVERAAALRIPVAPVRNGDTVLRHEHLVARGVFVRDADGRSCSRARRTGSTAPTRRRRARAAPRRAHAGRASRRAAARRRGGASAARRRSPGCASST